jgi:hypothetical protein
MKRIFLLLFIGTLLTFTLSLVNAPQAFADVKAVITIECDPDTDAIMSSQSSSGSPVTAPAVGGKCTDAMVFLDAAHFKVKETLRGVSATTINDVPLTLTGTQSAWHSHYLYVFFLD